MTESSVHVFLALPPLHYGTYWTFTHPASEVNEDALCQNEMTTAYQTAFENSKSAIQTEVSKKTKECPSKSITLSVTREIPTISASSQGVGFVAIKIKILLIIAM